MRTIRASEIGTYLYCRRAYWYQQQGLPSENSNELLGGSEIHARHGRTVATSGCLRIIAYILLLTALVLLTVYGMKSLL